MMLLLVLCLVTLTSVFAVPPVNDNCSGAINLAGTVNGTAFNLGAATTSGNSTSFNLITHDVWFYYTLTSNESFKISTCGSKDNTGLLAATAIEVWRFDSFTCPTLATDPSEVHNTDGNCFGEQGAYGAETGTIRGDAGDTFVFRVGGVRNAGSTVSNVTQGFLTIYTDLPTIPDKCEQAEDIPQNAVVQWDNSNADGWDKYYCGSNFADVWYRWTIDSNTGDNWASIDLCGTDNSFITVFPTSDCSALSQLNTENDVICSDYSSVLCGNKNQAQSYVQIKPGDVFLLRIGTVFGSNVGPGTLNISTFFRNPSSYPSNDECANAIPITTNSVNFAINKAMLSPNPYTPQDPGCGGSLDLNQAADVWFSWTPRSNEKVTFSTCNSTGVGNTYLQIIPSSCENVPQFCGNSELACTASDGTLSLSTSQFTPTEGVEIYYIRVLTSIQNADSTASGVLTITIPPAPSNDECNAALELPDTVANYAVTGRYATTSDNEATCTITDDIWFTWIAPSTSTNVISSCGSDRFTVLEVYRNANCDDVASSYVTCSNNGSCASGSALVPQAVTDPIYTQMGDNLLIRLGLREDDDFSSALLNIYPSTVQLPPDNDVCNAARPVPASEVVLDTTYATSNVSEASPCSLSTLYNDVWFSWTPEASGDFDLSICDIDFQIAMEMHIAGCPGSSTENGSSVCSAPQPSLFSSVDPCNPGTPRSLRAGGQSAYISNFEADAAQTYYIRVGSVVAGQSGQFTFLVTPAQPRNYTFDEQGGGDGDGISEGALIAAIVVPIVFWCICCIVIIVVVIVVVILILRHRKKVRARDAANGRKLRSFKSQNVSASQTKAFKDRHTGSTPLVTDDEDDDEEDLEYSDESEESD